MKYFIFLIPIFFNTLIFGQTNIADYIQLVDPNRNFQIRQENLNEIKQNDICDFWLYQDEIPIGFIGNDYQRLHIKFLKVIQDSNHPLQYFVYGKTKVKGTICDFQGTMSIKISHFFKSGTWAKSKSGFLAGDYLFYEDPKQNHSGVFKGKFVSFWYHDKFDKILAYTPSPFIENFRNHQFAGTWLQYDQVKPKKANWGMRRIPFSNDLDVGKNSLIINLKYQSNGWDSYIKSTEGGYGSEVIKSALEKENKKWWLTNDNE